MSQKSSRFKRAFWGCVVIFTMGFAAGYVFHGNQLEIQQTALERTQRAGSRLKQGAKASGKSLKEAAQEIVGRPESPNDPKSTPQ